MQHDYSEVGQYSSDEIRLAVERNNPEELRMIVVGASLHHEDHSFIEELCCTLSSSQHEEVKGNAILGFGHIARRFGQLEEAVVRPLIETALADSSEYVRGQAWAAADDVTHFLGWKIDGFDE